MFVRRIGSSVRLATSAVVAPRTFSSSKDKKPGDQINSMQSLWNLASDVGIPGIEKIGPRPCTSSVLLEKVKKYIEGQNDVSDKLNTSRFSRFREMDIEAFNQSRISLAGSSFFRNHVFFRE